MRVALPPGVAGAQGGNVPNFASLSLPKTSDEKTFYEDCKTKCIWSIDKVNAPKEVHLLLQITETKNNVKE